MSGRPAVRVAAGAVVVAFFCGIAAISQAAPAPVSSRLTVADLVAWLSSPDQEPVATDWRGLLVGAELDLAGGHFERAAQRFERAAHVRGLPPAERLEARWRASVAWQRHGKPAAALRVLEEVVAADRQDPALREGVAEALDRIGDLQEQAGNTQDFGGTLARVQALIGKRDPAKGTPEAEVLAHARFRALEPQFRQFTRRTFHVSAKQRLRPEQVQKAIVDFVAEPRQLLADHLRLTSCSLPGKPRRALPIDRVIDYPTADGTLTCGLRRLSDRWACASMVRRQQILRGIALALYRAPVPSFPDAGNEAATQQEWTERIEAVGYSLEEQGVRELENCASLAEQSDIATEWTFLARKELWAYYRRADHANLEPGPCSPLAPLDLSLPSDLTPTAGPIQSRDLAAAAALEALRRDAKDLDALVGLASALAGAGRYALAETALTLAERAPPKSAARLAEVRHALGRLALALGDTDRARFWLERALAADPQAWAAQNDLGAVLLVQRQVARAAAILEVLVRARPHLPSAHVGLGNSYLLLRQFPQARAAFEAALKLQPGLTEAWFGLGLADLHGRPEMESRSGWRAQFDRAEAAFEKYRTLRGQAAARDARLQDAVKKLLGARQSKAQFDEVDH